MTAEQLRDLAPPEGWEFVRRPSIRSSGEIKSTTLTANGSDSLEVEKQLKALFKWAAKNEIGLSDPPELSKRLAKLTFRDRRHDIAGYFWRNWTVKANAPARTKVRTQDWVTLCCGNTTEAGNVVCTRCYYPFSCQLCQMAGTSLYQIRNPGKREIYACATCTRRCETPKCKHRILNKDLNRKCSTCDPKVSCEWCGDIVSQNKANAVQQPPDPRRPGRRGRDMWMCGVCYAKRKCPECGLFDIQMEIVSRNNKKMCRICADKIDAAGMEKGEKFDAEELPISGNLFIPSTKERPFRTVSIETEMNGDGGFIARQLYSAGMVAFPSVQGYHQYNTNDDEHVAFLKHDGSVTGGELITFLMNLDKPDHVEAFTTVLRKLRGLKVAKKLSFEANCGGHIHIDAHNLDYSDAWRYITVYNYLENVIYRLAGAGCEYGHRSLDPRQYDARPGGYANEVVKGPFGTQSTFGQKLQQTDRTCGLNFRPFIEARNNCACGALMAESSKTCSCNLGKHTIEWRVWNSTINPRILHGWIALMQAVTAYAESDTKMTSKEEAKYPAFAWDRKHYTAAKHESESKKRLEWIHSNLPLTLAERDSLIYCAKNSELKDLGSEYLESLLQLENNSGIVAKKEARNPNRRKRNILIRVPTPGQQPVASRGATLRANNAPQWNAINSINFVTDEAPLLIDEEIFE